MRRKLSTEAAKDLIDDQLTNKVVATLKGKVALTREQAIDVMKLLRMLAEMDIESQLRELDKAKKQKL